MERAFGVSAPVDLCLPVLRLSRACGASPDRDKNLVWDHIESSDVFVVVKGDVQAPGELVLRIVQGTRTLESVDVSDHVDEALRVRAAAERSGVPTSIEHLPIFGITKEALLAIRFRPRADPHHFTRLQLRLPDVAQCRQVVEILRKRGMVFQEQRPGTARPRTANNRPPSASLDHRPQSSSYHVRQNPHLLRPSPFIVPHMAAGSLSDRHLTNTQRLFEQNGPDRVVATESRRRLEEPQQVVPSSTTTAQFYLSHPAANTLAPTIEAGAKQDLVSASSFDTSESSDNTSTKTGTSGRANIAMDTTAAHRSTSPLGSSNAIRSFISSPASSDMIDARPVTGHSISQGITAVPETLEHEIPPIRELPFKRPDSRKSDRPTTGSCSRVSGLATAPSRNDSRAMGQVVAGTQPGGVDSIGSKIMGTAINPALKDRTQIGHGDASVRNDTNGHSSPIDKIRPMRQGLQGREPLLERDTNGAMARTNSFMDAPHEIESPPSTAQAQSRTMSQTRPNGSKLSGNGIDRAYAAIVGPNRSSEDAALEQYSTQSFHDRQSVLEQYMMDNLENPAFATLCEDVENCWRKIALGL